MSRPDGAGWPVVVPPRRELEPNDPATVGPYRTEGVLGEGGMGRVYLGRTPAGGAVAVKVVHRELAADAGFRRRFEQEIATARMVHGLYTVPVVDADVDAERPWLATAYVPAASVQHVVTESGPLTGETGSRLVAGVAEALQSLHAAGVVHRDLKPSNVLLTDEGPRVIDFGISQAVDGSSVTSTGVLTGTPAFLAPEHIRGQEVTAAADVFALGVLAYFAVTGRLAFGGGHSHAVTYRILEQEPDLDGCPEPLRSIVVACLKKQPGQRPTPAEIIQRCQATAVSQPLPASTAAMPTTWVVPTGPAPAFPPGPAAPGPRPLTRRRLLLTAAGLVGAAGLGAAVPLLWPDNDNGDDNGDDSQQAKTPSSESPGDDGSFRLAAELSGHAGAVYSVSFGPDGRTLASGAGDDTIRLWDVPRRLQRAVIPAHGDGLYVTFSPDGQLLASSGSNETIRLWDVTGRRSRAILDGHTSGVWGVVFSPDGRLLASAGGDGIRLWDVAAGRQQATLAGHLHEMSGAVAFSPDGSLVASAGSANTVGMWEVAGGRQRANLAGHTDEVRAVAFSPDGRLLASASLDRTVRLWEVAGGRQHAVLDHPEGLKAMSFGPDGTLLATSNWTDRSVILWDVATGDQRGTLTSEGSTSIEDLTFSPDGRTLATTTYSTVTLWTHG